MDAKSATAALSKAEAYLDDEDAANALPLAEGAVQAFQQDGLGALAAKAVAVYARALCGVRQADKAETLVEAEIDKLKAAGDKAGHAKMLCALADVHASPSKAAFENALALGQQALELCQGLGDKLLEANALLTLSGASLKKGKAARDEESSADDKRGAKEAADAQAFASQALSIFKDLGDREGEGKALQDAADARALGENYEGALRAANEALTIFQDTKLRKREAQTLHSIALWHLAEEDVDEAIDAADEALLIYGDDQRATPSEASVMKTLARAFIAKKEPKKALQVAIDELERFEEAGDKIGEASCHEMMMLVYYFMDNVLRATSAAKRCCDALEDGSDRASRGRMLRTLCRLYAEQGQFDKALSYAEDSLEIFEDTEDLKEQALTLQGRADVFLQKQETEKALRCAEEARELYQDERNAKGEAQALLLLSSAQLAAGDFKAAASSAQEAQILSNESHDTQGEADAFHMLANAHMSFQEWEPGMRALQRLLVLEKELGHRGEEIFVMVAISKVLISQVVEKEQAGRSSEKSYIDGCNKSLKQSKEALSLARKVGEYDKTGAALQAVAHAQLMLGKFDEALKAVEEAISIFNEAGDARGEAHAFILKADVHFWGKDTPAARVAAEEGIWLFQEIGDALGEDHGWTELERIEAKDAEERAKQQQAQWNQQQQWQMSPDAMAQMQMQWQMQQGQAAPQQWEQPQEQASAGGGGGGGQVTMAKMDLTAGLDSTVLKTQILEVAKGLIGYDEEIEIDAPLMESGLTSNTAVLLRDSLSQQLPGLNLPVTLVFDYPSIGSMTELIMEKAEKAAKKTEEVM